MTVVIGQSSLSQPLGTVIYNENVAPDFSKDYTVDFLNNSSEDRSVTLSEIVPNGSSSMDLLNSTTFSFYLGASLLSAGRYNDGDLLSKELTCIASGATATLLLNMKLDATLDNIGQGAQYQADFVFGVTSCEGAETVVPPSPPPISSPRAPNTGLSVGEVLVGTTIVGAVLSGVLAIWVFASKNQRHKREIDSQTTSRGRKVLNVVSWVVLIAFSLTAILFAVVNRGNDVWVLGFKPHFLVSGSMEPEYAVNSLVVIKRCDFYNIKIGQPIAFRSEAVSGQTAFHRVVTIREDGLVVKGDKNSQPDGQIIDAEHLVGCEAFHTNLPATYIREYNQPNGWIWTIALPLLVIIMLLTSLKMIRNWQKSAKTKALIVVAGITVMSLATLIVQIIWLND
jgi:signal peptidase